MYHYEYNQFPAKVYTDLVGDGQRSRIATKGVFVCISGRKLFEKGEFMTAPHLGNCFCSWLKKII